MDLTCSKKGCKEIAVFYPIVELYPPDGYSYQGGPARVFFFELRFCEQHAKELKWENLIGPDTLTGLFTRFGQPDPDFSKSGVRLEVVPGVETV